jgi:predicted membrane channel-forming protein YqfA (hemolysin III family)
LRGIAENEDKPERLDRELIELLNELRVALPGVQVLFAFLLTVPFTQRFAQVTSVQKDAYFASLLCAAAATVLLIAPSTYHRLQWRQRDKEHMLIVANRLAIAGTLFLALAVTGSVFFVTDFLFGALATGLVTGIIAGFFTWFWYGLPLMRRLRD